MLVAFPAGDCSFLSSNYCIFFTQTFQSLATGAWQDVTNYGAPVSGRLAVSKSHVTVSLQTSQPVAFNEDATKVVVRSTVQLQREGEGGFQLSPPEVLSCSSTSGDSV